MKIVLYTILIVVLIFETLILRSVELINKNYLFTFDQGRDYLATRNIIVNHKFTLIGAEIGAGSAGTQGIFHGPFYYYTLTIPFLLFNGDPYGGMVFMFLFSVGAVILSIVLGKKLYGTIGGLVAGIFIALSPPLVAQARFIWNSHPTTFYILLVFIFTFQFIKTKRIKFLFLASFFTGFIYNYELAIAVPLLITLFLFSALVLRLRKIKEYFSLIGGAILAFSPMLLFEIKHKFLGFSGFIQYLLYGDKTSIGSLTFNKMIEDHAMSFWVNFASTFSNNNIIPPIAIFFVIAISVIYFISKEKDNILKNFNIFLLLLIPINFIVFSFLKNYVYNYYLIDLNVAYAFLFTYTLDAAYRRKKPIFKFVLTVFFIIIVISAVVKDFPNAKADLVDYGGTAKIKGKTDAIDFVYKDAKDEKFGLLFFSPPIYTYPYDYLIMWYAHDKYGYVPYQEKKGTIYLIIEKDPNKPWTYKGWLETVIKTGTIEYTKVLPSGFIVEKRHF